MSMLPEPTLKQSAFSFQMLLLALSLSLLTGLLVAGHLLVRAAAPAWSASLPPLQRLAVDAAVASLTTALAASWLALCARGLRARSRVAYSGGRVAPWPPARDVPSDYPAGKRGGLRCLLAVATAGVALVGAPALAADAPRYVRADVERWLTGPHSDPTLTPPWTAGFCLGATWNRAAGLAPLPSLCGVLKLPYLPLGRELSLLALSGFTPGFGGGSQLGLGGGLALGLGTPGWTTGESPVSLHVAAVVLAQGSTLAQAAPAFGVSLALLPSH